jgi:hypothetical protein
VVINPGTLKSFVAGVQSAKLKDVTIDETSIASIDNTINKANFNKYPFDIWIDKSNKIVDQLSLAGDSSGDPYTITLTLGHFNQPVTVTAPANPESVLQLLTQLGPVLNSLMSSGSSSSTSNMLNLLQQSL